MSDKNGVFFVKLLLSNNIVSSDDFTNTYTNFNNPIEFCAPELFDQELKATSLVTKKVDIFSLGVVLYYLSSGVIPFYAETKEEQIDKIKQI